LQELTRSGPEALPDILAAFDDADATAVNWLRAAVETVADRARRTGKEIPAERIEAFLRDTRRSGQARFLAFEVLNGVDNKTADRLLPGFLNDPGQELRRAAVARALEEAEKLDEKTDKPAVVAAYKKLLAAARDNDQVQTIALRLGGLGAPVDLKKHQGFIT